MRNLIRSTPFLAIVTCLLWSTAFFTIKIGLQYSTPLHFAGIRFMISGMMLLLFFHDIRKYFIQIRLNWKFIIKVAMLQTGILYFLFYIGLDMVPANVSAVITGAGPIFVSLLAHFFLLNDRLTAIKIASIAMGMVGIIMIGADRFSLNIREAREFWGIMILVLSNISGSFGNIAVSGSKNISIHPVVLNSAQLFTGGVFLFLISLFLEDHSSNHYTLEYAGSLLWLVFTSAAAYTLWFGLIRRPAVKVSELNVWKFMIPLFGALFSWMFLPDEHPEFIVIAGMAIITLALLLLYYRLVGKALSRIIQLFSAWRR